MQRTKQSNKANQIKPGYKQIGVQVKVSLWNEFRGKAIQQGKQAGTLLQEIIEDYLNRQNGQ